MKEIQFSSAKLPKIHLFIIQNTGRRAEFGLNMY